MTSQSALTVVTSILPARHDELVKILAEIEEDVEANALVPFEKLTKIHFGRWVILKKDMWGGEINPPLLVFSSNYDDGLDEHLDEMVHHARLGLETIYDCCDGFSKGQNIKHYLKDKRVSNATFFAGTQGRSVQDIKEESALRNELEDFLDDQISNNTFSGQDPLSIHKIIRNFVSNHSSLSHLKDALPKPNLLQRLNKSMKPVFYALLAFPIALFGLLNCFYDLSVCLSILIVVAIVGFIIIGTLYGLIPGILKLLNYLEAKEEAKYKAEDEARKEPANFTQIEPLKSLVDKEDKVIQNQMTIISNNKPGVIRNIILRLVLWAINLLAQRKYNKGKLGSISTIHFARWIIVEGRYLLFFSNYDGSWENYLGDFIDKSALGLTAIWSNCTRFPKTTWVKAKKGFSPEPTGGARNETSFKAYVRQGQVATNVWYSAHKNLSIENILNNSKIRDGLSTSMDQTAAQAWLRLFGRGAGER